MSASGTLETRSGVMPAGRFPWWLVLIDGIAAVIVGIMLFLAPQATLELVIQLFGLFWLIDGVLRLASAFTDSEDRGLTIAIGAAGVFAGIFVVRHPIFLAAAVTYLIGGLIGCAGIAIGALSLLQAFRGGGWGAGILGALSLVFGVLVLLNPVVNTVAWGYLYACASLIGGLLAIVVAFKVRKSAATAVPAAHPIGAGQTANAEPT